MTPQIWVQTIFGHYSEPFLEAALRSVAWADGFAVVNTDPEGNGYGQQNEAIVRSVVPREKLRVDRVLMSREPSEPGRTGFDFAKARNASLAMVPEDAFVLVVDSDDVHVPEMETECRSIAAVKHIDIVSFHFYHLAVYKDLLHSLRDREILFRNGPDVHFERGVHETLIHSRLNPALGETRYTHYGYIKPAREVSARWEFYRALGSEVHDYDVSQPDRALDDWPRICTPHWREHPPAVRELLESRTPDGEEVWPLAPVTGPRHGPRVGLVLLTWDDAENLKDCLASLRSSYEPYRLFVVDNGSTDATIDLLIDNEIRGVGEHTVAPDLSLAQALNVGFGHWLSSPGIDYIGWIHPDHVFEWPHWLQFLVSEMDAHPEWAKLGCNEAHEDLPERPGNSQCFIVRRTALEEIGLFDEGFIQCGGYEDWDMNRRLVNAGYQVMITPKAKVRHVAMATRSRHDNDHAGRHNAGYYYEKWGDTEPPV